MAPLAPGDLAPDFTLPAHDGSTVRLHDVPTKVVLWFYPQAMSPGCTTQACGFRDALADLTAAGYTVLGVSKDPIDKLQRFAERDGITYPLLSDSDLAVHLAYDAYGDKQLYGKTVQGVRRSTFVINPDHTIEHVFMNTKATGHLAMLDKRLHFSQPHAG